jgi:ATP-dependent exoDNAse (exonuclease V) alpha subunit
LNIPTVSCDPRRLRGVNVFREAEREFATGDRVQFTAANRDLGVANRDLGTVIGWEEGKMSLQMDGKSVRTIAFDSREFRQFDHGYAVTSHSSQGLTADRVLAHIDTESPRSLINNRLAYVSISRASDDARIYTCLWMRRGPAGESKNSISPCPFRISFSFPIPSAL